MIYIGGKMKLVVFFIFAVMSPFAESSDCNISQIKLIPNESNPTLCSQYKIQGEFSLKLCEFGSGSFTDSDGEENYLMQSNDEWFSRIDTYDYDTLTKISNIYNFGKIFKTFLYTEATYSRSGKLLKIVECQGTVQSFNN